MLRRAICFAADAFAVVNVERAAAGLLLGKDDIAAVAPQHPHGGFVHVAEEQRHDAAVEHGDARRGAGRWRAKRSLPAEKTWSGLPAAWHPYRAAFPADNGRKIRCKPVRWYRRKSVNASFKRGG